ncbi:hypothetical protein PvNV_044 [Penaeus vannamei nudivirus]|nr:hypothetical protein PvSNPV_044 [Penaeus vannamei nucleopolyhedrovirus]
MNIVLLKNTLDFKDLYRDIVIYEDSKFIKSANSIYFNILYDSFGGLSKYLLLNNFQKLTVEIKNVDTFSITSIIHNIIRVAKLINIIESLTIIY